MTTTPSPDAPLEATTSPITPTLPAQPVVSSTPAIPPSVAQDIHSTAAPTIPPASAQTHTVPPTVRVKPALPPITNASGKLGRVVVVTSGKGGVGKTTTTANIGTGLARLGFKVVLVDTDIGLRNLDILMGLENRIVYNLIDVIEERCKIHQALVKDKRMPNLMLLPAAQTRDKSALNKERFVEICEHLQREVDFVVLDCPAGIEQGFQTAIAPATEAILVVTPEMSAVRDADRVIGLLEASETIKHYKLVLNRVRPSMVKTNDMMATQDVLEILSIKLLGQIPEDKDIIISTNKGEPIVFNDTSLAGLAYRNIARRVAGEEVPFLNLDEPQSWFDRLKTFFQKPAAAAPSKSA
jgi:septum site-determining protein MinD